MKLATSHKTYLALGDSMSIDAYTGVPAGGAVSQLYRRLSAESLVAWGIDDRTRDGETIADVDVAPGANGPADLITVTIGGNDLLVNMESDLAEYLPRFRADYDELMGRIRRCHGCATVIVGNIYRPATGLFFGFDNRVPPHLLLGLDDVNRFIAACVREHGFRLADIRGAFDGHEAEYLCYGIEPTHIGATVIAGLFAAAYGLA